MSTALTQLPKGRQARPSLLPNTTPPWNQQAEQSVLGALLLLPSLSQILCERLEPEDFFLASHQIIFAAARTLWEEGIPLDPLTVAGRIGQEPDFESCGGQHYLATLPSLSVPALHAPHHADVVKALSAQRKGQKVAWALHEGQITVAEAREALGQLETTSTAGCLPVIDALAFCQQVPEEPHWVLTGYLARGTITELDAKIKTGKTHFTTDLVRALLAGEPFLDQPTTPTPVLYLTEERPTTFRAALRRAGLEEANELHLAFRHETRALWPEISRAVIARSKDLGIGLVVCDTLSDWSGLEADKENDAGAALEAMRPLQAIAAAGPAVLVLRHERKSGGEVGESARGSSAFGGAADILLSLRKETVRGHENRRVLEAVGRLEGTPSKLILEMTDGRYRSLGTSAQVEAENARRLLGSILPVTQDEALPEKQILELAEGELSRSTLKRALGELIRKGTAHRAKGAGSAAPRAYGFWQDAEAEL